MPPKDEDKLVYGSPKEAVAMARRKGWSDEKIILKLMSGRVYSIMRLKLSEFMIIAGLKKSPR